MMVDAAKREVPARAILEPRDAIMEEEEIEIKSILYDDNKNMLELVTRILTWSRRIERSIASHIQTGIFSMDRWYLGT
jgi:hypothetical protein